MIIGKKAKVENSDFSAREFPQKITFFYDCVCCENKCNFSIIPYKKCGFMGFNSSLALFNLSKEEIEAHAMADKCEGGKYYINGLHAMLAKQKCESCGSDYLVVIGFGEQQQGRMRCLVRGVWHVEFSF